MRLFYLVIDKTCFWILKNNDFGIGFYCTESIDLTKEWAVSSLKDEYASCYSLDTDCMRILN